jgi:hypothetical protein
MTTVAFPVESAEYRAARETLLKAELELKLKTEEVAALCRRLPAGGKVPQLRHGSRRPEPQAAFDEFDAPREDDPPQVGA